MTITSKAAFIATAAGILAFFGMASAANAQILPRHTGTLSFADATPVVNAVTVNTNVVPTPPVPPPQTGSTHTATTINPGLVSSATPVTNTPHVATVTPVSVNTSQLAPVSTNTGPVATTHTATPGNTVNTNNLQLAPTNNSTYVGNSVQAYTGSIYSGTLVQAGGSNNGGGSSNGGSGGGSSSNGSRSSTSGRVQSPQANYAASAVTYTANSISAFEAEMRGSYAASGSKVAYRFEYGTTTSLGLKTQNYDGSNGAHDVAKTLSGLQAGTTYHYRLAVTTDGSTVYGAVVSFTTPGTAAAYATYTAAGTTVANVATESKVSKSDNNNDEYNRLMAQASNSGTSVTLAGILAAALIAVLIMVVARKAFASREPRQTTQGYATN